MLPEHGRGWGGGWVRYYAGRGSGSACSYSLGLGLGLGCGLGWGCGYGRGCGCDSHRGAATGRVAVQPIALPITSAAIIAITCEQTSAHSVCVHAIM